MKTTTATCCLLVLLSAVLTRAASEVNSGTQVRYPTQGPISDEGSKRHLLGWIFRQAARYDYKETANTVDGDHTSKFAPTAAPAGAPLKLTGGGSRRHLQGYQWADQSRWSHGEKSKASVIDDHLYSDNIGVQGPFPAPAAGPASGVDAVAAAPAPSGNASRRLLLGLVNAAATSWGNADKDKADIQDIRDNVSETTATST